MESAIDPQLTGDSQPQVTLPTRNHNDVDNTSDGQGNNEGGEKRRKLNLLKCKQCRDARKKCFPVDRVWPQKCDRCLQHRPNQLACSEPQLNTRKRGPNQSKEKEKEKEKEKDKDPKLPRRSKTLSNSDRQEPQSKEVSDDDEDGSSDEGSVYNRPSRNLELGKGIKRERSPGPEPSSPSAAGKETQRPASAYLPLAEGQFRILQLDPGRKEDPITCSFVTASKDQPLKYEAISYLWGVVQSSNLIQLRDPQGKIHSIWIRSNVYAALRDLRHPKNVSSFWCDALCINHSNTNKTEKNRLVAMKPYIFHNAVNNCFWLGEDDSSKAALKFVSRILDLSGIDKLVQDNDAIQGWVAFVGLLKNPIFSRLWLVQEVAIARNVTLHCGQPAIHYRDLVEAVSIFSSFRAQISNLFRQNNLNYKDLVDRKVTIAESFINVSTNALRFTNGGFQRPHSLEALVSQLKDLTTTDPLDRIYSVLAIAKDGPPFEEAIRMEQPDIIENESLEIDYNKSPLEVYQDFVVRAIDRSQSLDIICRYWASLANSEVTLPTWVRPLQSTQPRVDTNVSERTDPESLVGLPDHNYYHASRGTVAHARSSPPVNNIKSLFARGVCIDTISKLGGRAPQGIILYEWRELGNCATMEDAKASEDFWRTLVADRGPNGSNTPSWYTRAFLYCLFLTPTGDIDTNRLIDECKAEESSLVVDFLHRVQSVIWNRKFLVSKDNKWIGLAPMAAKVGDVICILDGCSVPVVLRPWKRDLGSPMNEPEVYQLVGECYVHGMMDGEAKEKDRYVEEEFELR